MALRWPKALFAVSLTSSGKCEAELISHVNRESTLLRNLATILHSVKEDLTRVRQKWGMAHAWAAELSDALGRGGAGGEIQAACRHSTEDNPILGQSLKKVLHAYDLWPWVLNSGAWETWDLKSEARYIPTNQSKRGSRWRGLHTPSNSFSQMSLLDPVRLAARLH